MRPHCARAQQSDRPVRAERFYEKVDDAERRALDPGAAPPAVGLIQQVVAVGSKAGR